MSVDAPETNDLELLVPAFDEVAPRVSVVVPAMNEESTILQFVEWCHEGLRQAGLPGEILIVDSSTDRTPTIALEAGARVLRTPKRGLGRAYIDAVPFIRGDYVVMGDADCTYDFRELGRFVEKLQEGYDFAMGSRWLGSIESGSMPWLHRYVGTPITTWVLNRIYGSKFTDIHCGMRGITREALVRMGLTSQSWEYASEMVLKSVRMQLRLVEVPVSFYKDQEGRVSHHRRSGWFSPFHAAWINFRAMFTYRVEYFVMKPGLFLFALGLLLTLPLSFGSIVIGPLTFSLYWMLLGLTLAVLGLQSFFFGCLAEVFCDYSGQARRRWTKIFRYTRAMLITGVTFVAGVGLAIPTLVYYVGHSFRLPVASSVTDHLAITGILLMITGFSGFGFTLLLHATEVRYGDRGTLQRGESRDMSSSLDDTAS